MGIWVRFLSKGYFHDGDRAGLQDQRTLSERTQDDDV